MLLLDTTIGGELRLQRLLKSKHGYGKEVGEARVVLVSDHWNRTIFLSLKFAAFSLMSAYFLQ